MRLHRVGLAARLRLNQRSGHCGLLAHLLLRLRCCCLSFSYLS